MSLLVDIKVISYFCVITKSPKYKSCISPEICIEGKILRLKKKANTKKQNK